MPSVRPHYLILYFYDSVILISMSIQRTPCGGVGVADQNLWRRLFFLVMMNAIYEKRTVNLFSLYCDDHFLFYLFILSFYVSFFFFFKKKKVIITMNDDWRPTTGWVNFLQRHFTIPPHPILRFVWFFMMIIVYFWWFRIKTYELNFYCTSERCLVCNQ